MMIERGCDFAALCNSLLEFISEFWLNRGPLGCDGRIHLLGGSGILLVSTLLLGGCDGGICLLLGSTLLLGAVVLLLFAVAFLKSAPSAPPLVNEELEI